MNYSLLYEKLILKSKSLTRRCYVERHHILPRSMGGGDENANIAKLTPKEHFIAHRLLAKIHGGPMWVALAFMSRGGVKSAKDVKITSRLYEIIKTKDAEWKSEKYKGENNPFFGKTFTDEQLSKLKGPRPLSAGKNNSNYGTVRPDINWLVSMIHKYHPLNCSVDNTVLDRINNINGINETINSVGANIRIKTKALRDIGRYYRAINMTILRGDTSGSNNPNYGNGSAITGIKNPMFGKSQTDEAKRKISEKAKRKINCPHCGKIGSISNMKRWHFDKCKAKNNEC